MTESKRRKHPRCAKDTAISFSFLNQKTQYGATARNHSRFGMYFETYKSLEPGTLIVVRNNGHLVDPAEEAGSADITDDTRISDACRELKTQVIGEVKRCEKLEEAPEPRFGIAVHYVSPAA